MGIRLELPGLPPSINKAYFNLPYGGRGLTKEVKKYKTEVRVYLATRYHKELSYFKPNEPYLIFFRFTFVELENKTWGRDKKSAVSRYKRTDATNRIKLLEDVLKELTGVDDSNTMTFIVQKVKGPQPKREIFVWATQREESPFDEPLYGL